MKRDRIKSSNLLSVGYDSKEKLLEVEFKRGQVYQYKEVPLLVYQQLMSSSSPGTYFHQRIAPKYNGTEIYR